MLQPLTEVQKDLWQDLEQVGEALAEKHLKDPGDEAILGQLFPHASASSVTSAWRTFRILDAWAAARRIAKAKPHLTDPTAARVLYAAFFADAEIKELWAALSSKGPWRFEWEFHLALFKVVDAIRVALEVREERASAHHPLDWDQEKRLKSEASSGLPPDPHQRSCRKKPPDGARSRRRRR